ncbi:hypothetical protein K7X08_022093 [Anisodus acutangulus]|uniref:Gamma-glutamylcyclotransferase n=1 Tax=Anisodus acutangulus TaxID=402998 RepID=A0A9Q1L6F3_9SOLA|nr:hypothetical protein K7X08_022093 [Anisodus acutangulus]
MVSRVSLSSNPPFISPQIHPFSEKKLISKVNIKAPPLIHFEHQTYIVQSSASGFEYDEKMIGYIKDYKRVFDLACIDHRGTPEHPARTCTLEESEGAICWGAVYCVRGGLEKEKKAMEYLERRECEYDSKTLVDFFTEEDSAQPALTGVIVFTSTPDKVNNKYYLGPAPLEEMAWQIATAHGPCGDNREYIFKMEKALYDIDHEDDYIIELANEVRKVCEIVNSGIQKEKKLIGSAHIPLKTKISSPVKIFSLPEAVVAVAAD